MRMWVTRGNVAWETRKTTRLPMLPGEFPVRRKKSCLREVSRAISSVCRSLTTIPGLGGAYGAGVDFDFPGDDDPRRTAVRAWLEEHPRPTGRQLADAGYVAPHWPEPWGLDADPIHQIVIDEELKAAGVKRPTNMIGIGWAGPTIVHAGTDEQKQRYMTPLLAGEESWCQLFSEPGAGSDLANLSTRAVCDGDEWVVTGQKVWTSGAQNSQYGILIARTDTDVAKHAGVTYFICPMDTPGITVNPLREMTGTALFNEVFFDEVRIPDSLRVGDVNAGWGLAKVTLGNERVSLSTGGLLWGMGPTTWDLMDEIRAAVGSADVLDDPVMRDRIARIYTEAKILDLIRLRTVSAQVRGEQPGPEASIRKIMADEHGQAVMGLAKDLAGAHGVLEGHGPLGRPDLHGWGFGYYFARALTIGGGTGEVQRNILAERVLGLPHDVDVEAGKTWSEARRA